MSHPVESVPIDEAIRRLESGEGVPGVISLEELRRERARRRWQEALRGVVRTLLIVAGVVGYGLALFGVFAWWRS